MAVVLTLTRGSNTPWFDSIVDGGLPGSTPRTVVSATKRGSERPPQIVAQFETDARGLREIGVSIHDTRFVG